MPSSADSRSAEPKVGDVGVIISSLRPAGKAKFADAIVDVVTEAEFLENGTEVEIIKIQGNKVVTKKYIKD